MAVLILVLGGVVSAISAFAAWLLGANMITLLAVYFLSGLIFSGVLLYRIYAHGDARDAKLLRQINLEMLALREQLEQEHTEAARKTGRASIFALLRTSARR